MLWNSVENFEDRIDAQLARTTIISLPNDHSFMMRGLEAEFIWFFVSAPAFVLAIIHFVISYIDMSRKVKNPEQ